MKRHLIPTTLAAVVLCLGMAMLGFGQKTETGTDMANTANEASTKGSMANTTNGSLRSADKHFAADAAEGGMAEVELGKLAQEKASSSEVKDFAKKMMEDHSKANDDLKDAAQKAGISLPDHMSATQMAEKKKLEAESGAQFDRAYMNTMVKDHRQDVAAFKREANSGKSEEIKSFASNTLPTLEEHLRLAEKTDHTVSGSKGGAPSGGK